MEEINTVEFEIGGKTLYFKNTPLVTIEIGLAQLNHFLKTHAYADLQKIEWEIRLYEWILKQPDAENKAVLYSKARREEGFHHLAKRNVVKKLGWDIK